MSAARSLKMPDMPVAEAIASICMSIASKIGPSVSERWNSSCSTQSACPTMSDNADVGARVLADVPDRLAEELERERGVRLVHVVDLRDDRDVRCPVGRARHHHRRNAVVQHRTDLGGKARHAASQLLHRRDEARSRAGSGRLQVDLEHLELDGQRWLRDECAQHVFGHVGDERPEALHETPANAIDDLDVVVLHWPVAQIAALELIGFVRRELLDRDSQLAVLLQRLDKPGRELARE